jgi:hypothetical protein
MARAGRMTRRGLPRNPLELARLARTYDQEAHAPFLSVECSARCSPRSCSRGGGAPRPAVRAA